MTEAVRRRWSEEVASDRGRPRERDELQGAHEYLLTGKDGESRDRVSWTHTHNLASDDPKQAWKMMVATAQMQNELKAKTGIKASGRNSAKIVTHITLVVGDERDGRPGRR